MADDDLGILIAIVAGIVVLALIVVFGILSTRRKNRAATPSYHMSIRFLNEQPYLESNPLDAYDAKRQWQIFQSSYAPGSTVEGIPMSKEESADGSLTVGAMRVSRIQRGLREGYPRANVGFSAYFEPFEFAELPRRFPINSRKHAELVLDHSGVTVNGTDGSVAWSSPWSECKFAGHLHELKLAGGPGMLVLQRDEVQESDLAEALLEKYAIYWQLLV